MSKRPLAELDELLLKSRRLNAQDSLYRSAQELGEAARRLTQTLPTQSLDAAVDPLTRGLFAEVNSIVLQPGSNSRAPGANPLDLDAFLSQQHDALLSQMQNKRCQSFQSNTHNIQRSWTAVDWESQRGTFVESLGHQARLWGGSQDVIPGSTPQLSVPANPLVSRHAEAVRRFNLFTHGKQDLPTTPSAMLQDAAQHSDNQVMQRSDVSGYLYALQLLAEMVGETVIPGNPTPVLGEFSPICFSASEIQNEVVEPKRQKLTLGAKHFFEAQIQTIWVTRFNALGDIVAGDLGVRREGETTKHKLRRLAAYDFHVGTTPSACRSARFASHLNGPDGEAPLVPIWPLLYNALRCGKLDIAIEELTELHSMGMRDGEVAARTILRFLLGEDITDERITITAALREIRKLYAEEVAAQNLPTADPYRRLVLNLLGLVDRHALASTGLPNSTFEDFIWSHLWFIAHGRKLRGSLPDGLVALPVPAYSLSLGPELQPRVAAAQFTQSEDDFLELVYEYGGCEYFDADKTAPFKYAVLLMCCHRFGDAILHLWSADKVFAATHLMILCLHYGLLLPHPPLLNNPPHPLSTQYYSQMATTGILVSYSLTPAGLFRYFLQHELFRKVPHIGLDYAMSLNGHWEKHAMPHLSKELQMLTHVQSEQAIYEARESFAVSLTNEELEAVVGVPLGGRTALLSATSRGLAVGEGVRIRGRWDDYETEEAISEHLTRIGQSLLQQRRDPTRAIHFFLLAGNCQVAVEELVRQLTRMLLPTNRAFSVDMSLFNDRVLSLRQEQRRAWQEKAVWFVDEFVSSNLERPQPLVRVWTRLLSQHAATVDRLVTLLGVYGAIDMHLAGQSDSALQALDNLELIPITVDQIDRFVATVMSTDLNCDDVLLVMADVLKTLHHHAKRSPTAMLDTQLRARIAVLSQFTQRIKSRLARPDTLVTLLSLEASLV